VEDREHLVEVSVSATNQRDEVTAAGMAIATLPRRPARAPAGSP
jgi:hypothetical protein